MKYSLCCIDENGTKITSEFEGVDIFNITRNVYYFLLGVSFSKATIINGFENMFSEASWVKPPTVEKEIDCE